MNTQRMQSVREAFAALLAVDPECRDDELRRRFGHDPALAAEVESLLSQSEAAEAEGFLRPPEYPTDGEPEEGTVGLSPGDRVGPYVVSELLGRGGMGDVYLARRVEDYDQSVAIKFVGRGLGGTSLRRFHAERQLLAQLAHPNIVRLLDGGTTGEGEPYLVMEYVKGVPLDVYCRKEQADFRKQAELLLAVARAAAYAHEQDVLHRDLKPSNILVTDQGVPKVTDFGLARSLARSGAGATTVPGAVLGTPAYMAPEQVVGGQGRNLPAVDCYALGATLYRLLTGRHPFEAETHLQTCLLVAAEEPVPVRRLAPSAPRDLVTICLKAMAKDPAERFHTAEALAEELRRFAAGEPLGIRPPSPWAWLGRWAVRHRAGLAAWAVSVAVLLSSASARLAVQNGRLRQAMGVSAARLGAVRAANREMTRLAERLGREIPPGTQFSHDFYESMARIIEESLDKDPEAGRDPEVRYRLALAHFHVARSLDSRDAELNRPKTLEHYDRSVSLLRALAEENPGQVWHRYDLFRSLKCRAIAYAGSADGRGAGAHGHAEALAVVEALARDDPSQPDWRDAVANQHVELGSVLHHLGQDGEARSHFLRGEEVAARLSAEFPDRPRFLRNVQLALTSLGGHHLERGRPAEAEPPLRRAVLLARELAHREPGDVELQEELSTRLRAHGNVLYRLDRALEAEPLLVKSLGIAAPLAARFPENDDYLVAPLIAAVDLADVRFALGKKAEAEAGYREALTRLEVLHRSRPHFPEVRSLLARILGTCPVLSLRDPNRAKRFQP